MTDMREVVIPVQWKVIKDNCPRCQHGYQEAAQAGYEKPLRHCPRCHPSVMMDRVEVPLVEYDGMTFGGVR